ncbi:MAG TPA: hypothetical protein VFY18_13810 [Candidatus Limnocylindrales bacterium]|nr:hypothetical protein [Candidatus Limnocylindrales bacterium]
MAGRIAPLVIAIVVAACALMPSHGLQATIPATATIAALPVSLDDETGLVLGIASPAPIDIQDNHVAGVPGRPNALAIGWLGGACDHAVHFRLVRDGDRLWLDQRVDASDRCILVGISRSVVIELSVPVDPNSVVVGWTLLF